MNERRTNDDRTGDEDPLELVSKALREHPDGITNTVEIADRLSEVYGVDRTSRQVLSDLRVLERAGEVHSKKLGANAVGWIHDARLVPPTSSDEHDTPSEPDRSQRDQPQSSEPENENADLVLDAESVVNSLDIPGSGERQEERRQAILACIELIRETGSGRKSEFVEHIRPEYPGGYQTDDGWWNTVGKEGLHPAAQELDDIQPPSEGEHVYTIRPNVQRSQSENDENNGGGGGRHVGGTGDVRRLQN